MKATPFLIRVLAEIDSAIKERRPTTPRFIAKRVFPHDHPGWKRHTRCGHGTSIGGGMSLFMGGYIGKLRRAGLVGVWQNQLTSDGHDMLKRNKHLLD